MKMIKILSLIALIAPMLLLADGEEHHVAIGSRPMSEEATAQIEMEKEKQQPPQEEEGVMETAGFFYDALPPIYYSNSYHWVAAIKLDNGKYALELEDGSHWKISNYHASTALNWLSTDLLTITQNNSLFKRNHQILNNSNGTAIEATLFLGPLELGQYSRFIIWIDYFSRRITLSDNTSWEVSYLDYSIFKDWAINDYVIIGSNSETFWDSSSDALLINVNMNNHARAKQYYY